MKIFTEKHILNFILLCCLILFFCQHTYAQDQKTDLPTVYIYTDNNYPVTSKTEYLPARVIVKSSDPTEELDTLAKIRGRGNSTWGFEKQPYRIKLDKKHHFLNLPAKARNWTLLANHADKALIRNAVASKVSELVGLEFSPAARFVDLVLNDKFLGNYMVSDQMQVHKHRVNIDELTSEDQDDEIITGGYLLEIDGFAASEPEWFATTHKALRITIKSPDKEEITSGQRNYIKNFINEFERRLFYEDFDDPQLSYRCKVDTASLINWYIGCELTGNPDSFWSTYIYKRRGVDKLFFGPMWDYDIAFNNDDRLGDATRKLMREYAHQPRTWIEQLAKDEWFRDMVWQRWNELLEENILSALTDYVDELVVEIDESQRLNFVLWGGVNKKVHHEQYLFRTYRQGIDYLKTYLSNRIDFLTYSFEYTGPPQPSEIFVADEDAYYMIINKKSNNVIDVAGTSDESSPLVLWEPKSDDDGQLWEIIPAENDKYRFVSKITGLAIAGNGKENSLTQKQVSNDNSQLWEIVPVNLGNVYSLVNAASDYSANNSGGGMKNGNPVIEYDKGIIFNGEYNTVESENRQWYLQKMEKKTVNYIEYEIADIEDTFSVYPLPAVDHLYVEFETAMESSISIAIYNLLGKEIYKEYQHILGGKHTFKIETNRFEPGIYLITILTDKGENYTKKVIVKK